MALSRRAFVHQVAGVGMAGATFVGAAARLRGSATSDGRGHVPIRAVLFDAFPVFDPRPISALAEEEFPGHGAALVALWRTRQFEYGWLRSLSRDYVDFWQCTDDALRFAAASLHLELTSARRERLLASHLALRPWPDAPAALGSLRRVGVRLAFLSNFTPSMLDAAIRGSGLGGMFAHVLSTDHARTYKPDPRAYQLGVDAMGLPREQVLFAAFAGWDAAGAKRFGYPTFWVNRLQAPLEELGAPPDGVGASLDDLVAFVTTRP
jgi:2-haloacid dehalogenase